VKWNKKEIVAILIALGCLGVMAYFSYRLWSALYGFFLFVLIVFVYGSGGSL